MLRSGYSTSDRGGTPRFDLLNLVKKLSAVAMFASLGVLGTSSLASAAGALAQPTAVVAGNGVVTVSFTADNIFGGAAGEAYTVTSTPGSATCTVSATAVLFVGQKCSISKLTVGTPYTFVVSETGGTATSTSSIASAAITPTTAVATPSASGGGVGTATVTFTADGVATTYTVSSSTDSMTCTITNTTPPTGAQSCNVTDLTAGSTYNFIVTPSGGGTTSTASPPSATYTAPLTAPSLTVTGLTGSVVAGRTTVVQVAGTGFLGTRVYLNFYDLPVITTNAQKVTVTLVDINTLGTQFDLRVRVPRGTRPGRYTFTVNVPNCPIAKIAYTLKK